MLHEPTQHTAWTTTLLRELFASLANCAYQTRSAMPAGLDYTQFVRALEIVQQFCQNQRQSWTEGAVVHAVTTANREHGSHFGDIGGVELEAVPHKTSARPIADALLDIRQALYGFVQPAPGETIVAAVRATRAALGARTDEPLEVAAHRMRLALEEATSRDSALQLSRIEQLVKAEVKEGGGETTAQRLQALFERLREALSTGGHSTLVLRAREITAAARAGAAAIAVIRKYAPNVQAAVVPDAGLPLEDQVDRWLDYLHKVYTTLRDAYGVTVVHNPTRLAEVLAQDKSRRETAHRARRHAIRAARLCNELADD